MPEIKLENLSKTFDEGRIIAVEKVSLTIQDREYVFILGPSGCGKTTLLKMISGLYLPTSGNIFISGKNVTQDPPQSRGIAFIFQHFEIFPMSVWENTIYSLKVRGYPEEFIIREGQRALRLTGLVDRANQIPRGWSNGDLQKVGLARAICSGAKILIMDEPLGSLDPKVNKEFRWELRKIIKESGITAIQVTHDQEEAMSVADRIIVMREGKLLQEDKQNIIYNSPNSLFVGNFLGGLNVLEGYIYHIDHPDRYTVKVRLGGPKYEIINQGDRFKLDENVVIALRFEDVYIFPLDYDYKKNAELWEDLILYDGRIIEKFLTGKERMFVVEMDNGDKLTVKKRQILQLTFEINQRIKIGLFAEDLMLFKRPKSLADELALK